MDGGNKVSYCGSVPPSTTPRVRHPVRSGTLTLQLLRSEVGSWKYQTLSRTSSPCLPFRVWSGLGPFVYPLLEHCWRVFHPSTYRCRNCRGVPWRWVRFKDSCTVPQASGSVQSDVDSEWRSRTHLWTFPRSFGKGIFNVYFCKD